MNAGVRKRGKDGEKNEEHTDKSRPEWTDVWHEDVSLQYILLWATAIKLYPIGQAGGQYVIARTPEPSEEDIRSKSKALPVAVAA